MNDTIAAVATAPGRSAVGILRLSGPQALAVAEAIAGPLPPPRRAALRALRDRSGSLLDRGLVLAFPAPASYTGEHLVELQAHGGPVLLQLLLETACSHGARPARPGEFSERAFLNGRLDLAQAEAVADLIDAASRAAVTAATRSLEGVFSQQVQGLAGELMNLRAWVEGALDFSDEDMEWLADATLLQRLQHWLEALQALQAQTAQGRRLREGLVVAIVGQPNVGKSTLLNRLAGVDAAIVSEIPGTTRDLLREHLVLDGLPLTIVDTAGLRDTEDRIEAEGIRRAWTAVAQAELVLFVLDDRSGPGDEGRALLQRLPPGAARLLVANKADLSGAPPARVETADGVLIRCSAATGAGFDLLRAEIRRIAGLGDAAEPVFSARARHVLALAAASEHVHRARAQLQQRHPAEIAAEELRLAQQALSDITGAVSSEDLLGSIFASFCIGK